MKKGKEYEVTIDSMKYPNIGVAIAEDTKIHVKKAIMGQKLKIRTTRRRSEHYEAKVVEVLEKAPFEQESFCEHFGECGGCAFQTVPYEEQLKMKQLMVKKMMQGNQVTDYEDFGIVPSPTIFNYRNKMEYSFGDEYKDGPITLGMHKMGRYHDIVTVDKCHIADQDSNEILKATLKFFQENNIPRYNKVRHTGFQRHLVVRKGTKTKEILIGLSASTQFDPDLTEWINVLKDLDLDGQIVGILKIDNDGKGDAVNVDKMNILLGRDYYYEELFDLRFKVSFQSFFQTNTLGAEKLYQQAIDFTPDMKSKVVYDLFSGTGTIGQIISKDAKKVYGIELVEDAVKAANENKILNNIDNAEFIAGDVFQKLGEIKEKPDVIIVDPPRSGIGEKAMAKILNYKVPYITYVSCNPKTLATDLNFAQKNGYTVEKFVLVDMFPHTQHVESIALLRKIK